MYLRVCNLIFKSLVSIIKWMGVNVIIFWLLTSALLFIRNVFLIIFHFENLNFAYQIVFLLSTFFEWRSPMCNLAPCIVYKHCWEQFPSTKLVAELSTTKCGPQTMFILFSPYWSVFRKNEKCIRNSDTQNSSNNFSSKFGIHIFLVERF